MVVAAAHLTHPFTPLARWANTVAVLNGNEVYLYYLPLALVLSLMLFFGWAALPGIVVGLLLSITRGMTLEDSIGVIFHFLIPTVLCWGGYRVFVPRRQQISHGNVRLMPQRLFWQMLLPSLIFLILSQLAEYLGIHPRATGLIGSTLKFAFAYHLSGPDGRMPDRRAAMLLSYSNYPQPALYSGFCFSDSPADRSENKALRVYFMGGSAVNFISAAINAAE
jgi:hypothetical protein